jgi:hypothetical protein
MAICMGWIHANNRVPGTNDKYLKITLSTDYFLKS